MSARRPQLIQQLFAVVAIVALLAMSGLSTEARAAQDEKITLRVFGPDHIILAVVEANDIEPVREFVLQSRLIQWNTTKINATYSIEEALAKSDELEAIY